MFVQVQQPKFHNRNWKPHFQTPKSNQYNITRRFTPPLSKRGLFDTSTPTKRRTLSENYTSVILAKPAHNNNYFSSTSSARPDYTYTCAELEATARGTKALKSILTCAEIEAQSTPKRSQSPTPSASSGYESCCQQFDLESEISNLSCPPSPSSEDSAFNFDESIYDFDDLSLSDNLTIVNSKFAPEIRSSPFVSKNENNLSSIVSENSTLTPLDLILNSIQEQTESLKNSTKSTTTSSALLTSEVKPQKYQKNILKYQGPISDVSPVKYQKTQAISTVPLSKSSSTGSVSGIPSKFFARLPSSDVQQNKHVSRKIQKKIAIAQDRTESGVGVMPSVAEPTPIPQNLPPPPMKWTKETTAQGATTVDITDHIMLLAGVSREGISDKPNGSSPITVC